MSTQSFSTWLRHPGSIILIIALVLMFVVLTEQSRQAPNATQAALLKAPGSTGLAGVPHPSGAKMGGELPKIVRQFAAPTVGAKPAAAPGRLQAPDLGSLLGRLEEKVKAEPDNIGNRLLLAQTYNELGLVDKALKEARDARTQAPDHARVKLVLASILSKQESKEGLNEAKDLLEGLKSEGTIKQYLVSLYLGDTLIRLGDHDLARKNWQQALEGMPVTDNRRAGIEKRIADLSAKAS